MIQLKIPYKYHADSAEVDWLATNKLLKLYINTALKQTIPIEQSLNISIKPNSAEKAYIGIIDVIKD